MSLFIVSPQSPPFMLLYYSLLSPLASSFLSLFFFHCLLGLQAIYASASVVVAAYHHPQRRRRRRLSFFCFL